MNVELIVDSTVDVPERVRSRLTVVPLTIHFGQEEFLDGVTMDRHRFYERLVESDVLPTTSQASPAAFDRELRRVRDSGSAAVVLTISSKLSGTYQSACIAAADYDNVYVVDSGTAAIGTGILAEYALTCIDRGMDAAALVRELTEKREDVCVLALVDTLEYLKRGGRISKTTALAGGLLNIKPVLTIQGEKLDAFEKARGVKQAKKAMIKAMKKDMDKRFAKERAAGIMGLHIAYTANDKEVIDGWIVEVKEAFPDFEVDAHPLSLSVACHIGPGALAIACEKKSAIS